jgi:hypothetical protein
MSMRLARGLLAALVLFGAALAPAPAEAPAVGQKLLVEVAIPSLGFAEADQTKQPPVDLKGTNLKTYPDSDDAKSAYQNAVRQAQVLLWATTTATPPPALQARVLKVRKELKVPPPVLKGRYLIPSAKQPKQLANKEKQLKAQVLNDAHHLARMTAALEEMLESLDKVEIDSTRQTPRWQANYALVRGSLMLRLCYLEDHELLLGAMRKDFPPHGKGDTAWLLRPAEELRDSGGRKRLKKAQSILAILMDERRGTVWERVAERARRTRLGTEWQAVR